VKIRHLTGRYMADSQGKFHLICYL